MAFDTVMTTAVVAELAGKLLFAGVDRICQPGRLQIALHLHQRWQPLGWLLLSAEATSSRVHLSQADPQVPPVPPAFCMVLRKYLEGGRILSVSQPEMERVIVFAIANPQASLPGEKYLLVAEIMGKHSNILLVDPATDLVVDAVKRYGSETSRYREVYPGQPYLPPPPQKKADPLTVNPETFTSLLLAEDLDSEVAAALAATIAGTGPQLAREIVARAGLDPRLRLELCGEAEFAALWQALQQLWHQVQEKDFSPTLVRNARKEPEAYSALHLAQYPPEAQEAWDSVNGLLDYYFTWQDKSQKVAWLKSSLQQVVARKMAHVSGELGRQQEELQLAGSAGKYLEFGEIVKANLYRLQPGQEVLAAENFFTPDCPVVTIPLDPALTGVENAQAYFRRYRKAGRKEEQARRRLAELEAEKVYLESVALSLENTLELPDLEEIRQELVQAGYLAPAPQPGKPSGRPDREMMPRPLEAVASTGVKILVGKNNRQNDRLSTKMAHPGDYWFHAQGVPGSHVVLRTGGETPERQALEEAALLAAYFSRGREAGKVAVDYTRASHVWKPKGAPPGKVLYDHQQTLMVRIDAHRVAKLLAPGESS
ncbi:MAG: DUF814 domain-containing protein [Clostridia bacterium]|nr:MAG: DUF814 domain-containing protein [Clostridia bacterium]